MRRSTLALVMLLISITATAPPRVLARGGDPRAPVPARAPVVAADDEEPVEHALSVVLEPGTSRLTVHDTITLPPSLRHAGAAFTLSPVLAIRSSAPPVAAVEPAGDETAARYALETAPADGVLRLAYDGTFDFGLSDQKEEYTRGFRETRGIIGPQGVYLDGDSAWVPQFDDRMIRFSVDVETPDGWHVISQGDGTSRGEDGRARWESGRRLEQVYLVGGPLEVERDTAGAVETLVYLHERDEALSRKYLDTTARYLEMYRQLIGPYPYGKFALVENFWETGYGMPSFTLLGPQVIRFPFILHSSYPHEILHNWWGNSVFVDYESGNWCEGLTAYLADHLVQEQRGQGSAHRRAALQKYRDYAKEGRDFPLTEFRSRHSAATEAVGYGKAMMTFHMLRRRIGDDAFRAGLATAYRTLRGRRARFDDLRSVFESVSEQDLGSFFRQWIERTGAPALALTGVERREVPDGFVVTGTLEQLQTAEPYALAVPLLVDTGQGAEAFTVETSGRAQPFELRVDARPRLLAADPWFDLFRVLDPRETPASIGQIFGEPAILAVLPTAADAEEVDRYRELVEGWRSDEHEIEIVFDTALTGLPEDRAAWILGRDNRWARAMLDHAGAALDEGGSTVTMGGETRPLATHSFVVIRRHPHDIEKAIGWIAVEPEAAFPGLGRKLPHYGKYSYLAFEGAEPTNVAKGQWDLVGSPLVVDLREDRRGPLPSLSAETRAPLADLPPVFTRRALLAHVDWLAAPEREGRGLGSAGLGESAAYIARHFADSGLEPGGDDGSWFQRFTVAEGPDGGAVETVNVIGLLPGTRADWSDQSIVLSAHYDHLGRGWPDARAGHAGVIHPGADDNASGVAVLLELARNLAAEGGNARTLVLIAFSAEECGRQGSRHYVEHPRLPAGGIRGVINLDTVGRLEDRDLSILGTATADEWPHIFRGCGFVTGIGSRNVPEVAEASDQMSFIERGIPGVQVFTGAHEDYHRPGDMPEKVDGAGLVKVATFVKEAVVYLLAREEPLTVRIEGSDAAAAGPPPTGGRKILFGTVPEFEFRGEGVKIASLVPDSPAARAGLRAGDVLVQLDDREIPDLRVFSQFLRTLQPGQAVEATVIRDGARLTVRAVVEAR